MSKLGVLLCTPTQELDKEQSLYALQYTTHMLLLRPLQLLTECPAFSLVLLILTISITTSVETIMMSSIAPPGTAPATRTDEVPPSLVSEA